MAGQSGTALRRAEEPGAPKKVPFSSLVGRINAAFDAVAHRAHEIFERNGRRDGHDLDDWLKAENELFAPMDVEITETDSALEVKAQIPGFTADELELSVEPTRLTITGKHRSSKQETKEKSTYSEMVAFDVLRVIALPEEVDAAKATATAKNGALDVILPKAAVGRTIKVSGTGQDAGASSKSAGERETRAANAMETEMEERDQERLEDDRAVEEDLNQGMSTGTYDSIHRGVNWPASYRIRRK